MLEARDSAPVARGRSEADLRRAAWRIRQRALTMVAKQGFGYLGQALSAAEIAAVLYCDALNVWKDRLVISPGHYAIVHFAAGAEVGLFADEDLDQYGEDGSDFETIGTESTPALAATCGSLGQGLSVAAGLALGLRIHAEHGSVFALVSDGEMEEGQLWEAAMFAAHHRLGSLTVLLDRNHSQVDGPTETVTTLEPVADKWRAFGWAVETADGHDVSALRDSLATVRADERPGIVIATTWTLSGLADLLPDEADGHFLKVDPLTISRAAAALADAEQQGGRPRPADWETRA
jgi:transketolase